MIDLNKVDLKTLETMYSLLIEYKDIFLNDERCNGLCYFFRYLAKEDFISFVLFIYIHTLIDYISNQNDLKIGTSYWFKIRDYELRKKYIEDLIEYNKYNKYNKTNKKGN